VVAVVVVLLLLLLLLMLLLLLQLFLVDLGNRSPWQPEPFEFRKSQLYSLPPKSAELSPHGCYHAAVVKHQ